MTNMTRKFTMEVYEYEGDDMREEVVLSVKGPDCYAALCDLRMYLEVLTKKSTTKTSQALLDQILDEFHSILADREIVI